MQNLKGGAISGLIGALTVFMIIASVSSAVGIFGKIKEAKDVEPNVITITETGEVFARPDLALISFSVITEDPNVQKAMSENAEKMNKLISSLKDRRTSMRRWFPDNSQRTYKTNDQNVVILSVLPASETAA